MSAETPTDEEPRKRGKAPRKRRNYAAEVADLEGRIKLAARLVRPATTDDQGLSQEIAAVLLEVLEGK